MRNLIQICLLFAMALQEFTCGAQPVITVQPTNQTVVVGDTANFSVSVSGTGPFSYQWQFNGTNLPPNGIFTITTVAGNGTNSFSGDGGAATNAAIKGPYAVAVDANGNLFITDNGNDRIRKVSTNGIITTVAGNGINSFSGDDAAATNATLNFPNGVTVDTAGNLFIADSYNQRIRKVDAYGIITTVAGNGSQGFFGDGGVATNAWLHQPGGVAVDAGGNLFIADTYNYRIRKVSTNGIITTVAGNGNSSFSGDGGAATNAAIGFPFGAAVDAYGNLFIADYNGRIRRVDTNGIITTVAGNGGSGLFSGDGGAATNASLYLPSDVTVDAGGNLFIADLGHNRIRMVSTIGIITTVAGNDIYSFSGDGGAATNATINVPYGMAVDSSGNLFIADTGNNRIRKLIGSSYLPSLILNTVSKTNAGDYSVVITGSFGSVTSSVAHLIVNPASITQQPQNQAQLLGKAATFSVVASTPAPLTYQWYFSNPALQTTARAKAQTSNGFVISTSVTNGGSGYTTLPQVQFVGGGGTNASGKAAITNGHVTTITMTNAGSGYTYPPAVLIDPPNGLLIGQTNATVNLSAITTNNFGSYFVVISNIFGSLTSSVATLSLAYPPSITQQPQNQTIGSGASVGFNVIAVGTPPFSYQWWMVSGQKTNATALAVVSNKFVVRATITKAGAGYLTVPTVQFTGGGGSGASGTAMVSNRMVTAINIINAGSGYTTRPTIQIAAPTSIKLAGQTDSVLSLAAVTNANAGNYYVVVTNNFGSVTSQVAVLTVALPGYNQITGQFLTNGSLRLSFVGLAGTNYVLDRTFKLSLATWVPQATNRAGSGGVLLFTNTPNKATNNFWRIRSVP